MITETTSASRDAFIPSPIPRLRTARLLLREQRLEDFGAFAAERADPAASTYVGGVADRTASWRAFLGGSGGWVLHGLGWWAVEEVESRASIGSVGVFRREVPNLEIGWRIYRASWGRGYAPEAARAALEFAKDNCAGERVIAHISKGNGASIRVAEKIGMRLEGEVDFMGEMDWLYVA